MIVEAKARCSGCWVGRQGRVTVRGCKDCNRTTVSWLASTPSARLPECLPHLGRYISQSSRETPSLSPSGEGVDIHVTANKLVQVGSNLYSRPDLKDRQPCFPNGGGGVFILMTTSLDVSDFPMVPRNAGQGRDKSVLNHQDDHMRHLAPRGYHRDWGGQRCGLSEDGVPEGGGQMPCTSGCSTRPLKGRAINLADFRLFQYFYSDPIKSGGGKSTSVFPCELSVLLECARSGSTEIPIFRLF